MATLTETAYHTRRLIKFSLIGVVCLLLFRAGYIRFKEYWLAAHPPPPPKPTMAFGKLPKIPFPEQEKKEYVFKLETISGGLPNLSDQAKVYFIPKGAVELSTLDRAKEKVAKLGFTGKPIKISESTYRWIKQDVLISILTMNIIDGNFTINRNWQDNLYVVSNCKPLKEEKAASETKNYLARIGLLSKRLTEGEARTSYLRFVTPNLVPAVSFSEADLTRVDLFPAPPDGLPIFYEDPSKSLISFLLSASGREDEKFLQVKYHHQPILEEKFATYPLKTTAQAWSELRAGEAYIFPDQTSSETVTIRNIYLGYFVASTPINYLIPIFIFQGDEGFYAYVSAINSQWVEE